MVYIKRVARQKYNLEKQHVEWYCAVKMSNAFRKLIFHLKNIYSS